MNRVFYFSGHRLTVFHWDHKKFHGACSFEPDEEGLEKFKQYLTTSAKSPARLLVDVIEEDFRTESAPHVYGKDKKAVINRLLDRYYRSSGQYVYSEVIGREKTGRKDDRVLIGGITNPRLISVWKNAIEECQIPLIGIWTLPLISKNLLPLIGEKRSAVLLVSQQVSSNLRQTFLRDGKMLSTRQSVINQDEKDISNIGKYAAPEVERTVAFLRNQRLINANEVVHIHIIGSAQQIKSLENEFRTDALNDINVHNIADLESKAGIDGLSGKFSDGLYTWLCAKQVALQAHYGEAKEYSQYYYVLASKALTAASIILALFASLIIESNISSTIESERSAELLRDQTKEYENVYRSRFEEYEVNFERAHTMKSLVDLSERVYQHGKVSPLDFMIELSEVLSQQGMGVNHVNKIEWKAEQYKFLGDVEDINQGGVDVTIEDSIRHVGIVHGQIAVSDKNYRGSVSQVNRIVAALSQHKRVDRVEAIEMPVEVRSEKTFNDESGLSINNRAEKDEGRFAIKITMKAINRE